MCRKIKNGVFLTKKLCFLVWVLSIHNIFGTLSVDQLGFGDPSWGFIDPLKELASAIGTLEIESVWVGSGVGGS